MIKRFVFIALIISMFLVAGTASATLVQLKETGTDPAGQAVNISGGVGGSTWTNAGVYAGNYVLDIQGLGGNIHGFCIDPAGSTLDYQPYNLVPVPDTPYFNEAAWILSQYPNGGAGAVAAQVAVWELVWIGVGGTFTLNSGVNQSDVTTIIDNAIAGVAAGFDTSAYALALSPTDQVGTSIGVTFQDYIIPNPTTVTTPIPAAVWLLGSGLVGLVGIRRRLRKK